MFYREAGQFKSSYKEDQAVFPILQDRIGIGIILLIAFVGIPLFGGEYFISAIMTPFLILALAAIGLNILTGYAGQISLGTGGFMAVGAFAAYKFATFTITVGGFEGTMPLVLTILLSGLVAALVGIMFGIPSLRIKGFYLAVATLAAQFFLEWLFVKVGWFTNYSPSGVITAPPLVVLGYEFNTAAEKYIFTLVFVAVLALAAKNLVRSHIGRGWMAIRDMDIAAEIIGFKPLQTKLSAFAVSSFFCGVAGALWAFVHLGTVEPEAFGINRSFAILFMVIIGGMGSILGSFIGAGFIMLLPIFLNNVPPMVGWDIGVDMVAHLEFMVFGVLIIFFLIVEPHGLARLWTIGKEKLRTWPFPY
ncbi:branched-chain amino acid ABC transporter permease [Sneathiella limimaris]|uniref:branched-chain amino acid ABC transporter permease n=1 Tax=Sneathiella limimaris TaxID=1964213 RepID=UPI00146CF58E|nr:branched-chain amino acid ABC transporter permease [Sneathiella limimaris]